MRIFTGFLILLCSVVLWFLPVSEGQYSWATNPRTDDFVVTPLSPGTAANVTLVKEIYDDDVSTLIFSTNFTTSTPYYSSYNGTSRVLLVGGLGPGVTQALEITYDVSAFPTNPVMSKIGDVAVWMIYIFFVLFGAVGIYYILPWGKWLGG